MTFNISKKLVLTIGIAMALSVSSFAAQGTPNQHGVDGQAGAAEHKAAGQAHKEAALLRKAGKKTEIEARKAKNAQNAADHKAAGKAHAGGGDNQPAGEPYNEAPAPAGDGSTSAQ